MKINQRVVIISLLVLPAFLYLMFVYGLKDVFFETLEYIGPRSVVENVADDGEKSYDTAYYKIPNFSFTNFNGRTITQDDLKGKIYVASFFFASCPTICPKMNFHLTEIQKRFAAYDDFYLLSHTVDPERDSVQALDEYVKNNGFDTKRWYFVTGERDKLYAAAQSYFLSAYEDDLSEGGFLHSQNAVLVDWEGHIRSRVDEMGNPVAAYDLLEVTQLKDLEEDIKVLKAEYEKYKHNLEK